MISRLVKLGSTVDNWIAGETPWTNVYGLARSMMALASAATLLVNKATVLMYPSRGCQGRTKLGLFCLMSNHLELARWIAVVAFLAIASGWRPRITGLPHWWLSVSFMVAARPDGGDIIAAVITLLLVPVCLTDTRTWHWETALEEPDRRWQRVWALSALLMVRIQVCLIYCQAAFSKTFVPEWQDGTAVYYLFSNPFIGVPSWELRALMPLLTNGVCVAILTWGAITIEILLFMSLFMSKRAWPYMLWMGIFFHVSIFIVHGIPSFSFVVIAALILYLRPVNQVFSLPLVRRSSVRQQQQQTYV
jgi:antimicrobial peptide system SdpB family protein